jgi:hypothetical protein
MRPDNDEERMEFTRRVAHYHFGEGGWADDILTAYWDFIGETADRDDDDACEVCQ